MTANGSVVESSKSSLIGSPSARLKLQTFVSHRVNSPRTPKDEIEVKIIAQKKGSPTRHPKQWNSPKSLIGAGKSTMSKVSPKTG